MAERAERRLTTILAADIAEYSRLMRADEDATMRALGACRAVVDALVAEHRGVSPTPRAMRCWPSFPASPTASPALWRCSRRCRRKMPMRRPTAACTSHRNSSRRRYDEGRRPVRRRGHIAARLEALAEPGGICVSAAVREHVGTRAEAVFTDIGAQQVKNIADPVHVFRAGPFPTGSQIPLPNPPSRA